ncbi:MAG: phosphatidate cytidylyltransferase [Candidatus Omnitrophota bacterium]|nr:phosphatidate cytidylyltransferase [Candidatus Omnitrophota bacterium]MBU1894567.1 phosphatidate cytidylyltransferase [Candidatus Omnitrophota bacterium]
MSKFALRTIMSLILIFAVTIVIYFFPNWAFCLVISIFVAFGQFEFFQLVEKRGIFVYKYFGTALGAAIPFVVFLGNSFSGLKDIAPIFIVAASLLVFTLQFTRRDNARDHLISTALTMFSLFYISWFFSFFVELKLMENGANLVMFLIVVTKSTDIGAYVIGSFYGRHDLIPRISPKKTKEGTLAGILTSLIIALVLGKLLTGFSFGRLFILGIVLATLGQVGDLAESLIKRDCSVKDSSTRLPGIGGMLDLIDSLLFTAPVFYFYLKTF